LKRVGAGFDEFMVWSLEDFDDDDDDDDG